MLSARSAYCLLFSFFCAHVGPALAQAPASVSLPAGIPLKRIGYAPFPAVGRHLLLTVGEAAGRPRRTPVQVQVYDSTLHLVGQHSVQLRGTCTLLSTAPIKGKYLSAFQLKQRNPGADSVLLVSFDASGQLRGLQASRRHINGKNRTTPLNLPTANLLVKSAGSSRRRFTIQSLAPSLLPRWEQTFVAPKGAARLNAYAADSTHLWLLLTEHANSRRNTPVAVCLDAATGRQLSRTPITTGPGLREASTCIMEPDHSLLLIGHAFSGQRPKNARMGDLFILRLRPDGRVLTDQQVTNVPLPPRQKVLWQQVQPNANGGLRVIGETYTKTSAGAAAGFYALTYAATFSFAAQLQSTLRPRNLLVLDLDAAGKLKQQQLVALPKGGSMYKGRYMGARRLAREADAKGTFRYRATGPSRVVLLRTKEQLLQVKPGSKVPVVLRKKPAHHTQDIAGVSGRRVLVTQFDKKKKQFSLLRLKY